jgi:hypothetical protein
MSRCLHRGLDGELRGDTALNEHLVDVRVDRRMRNSWPRPVEKVSPTVQFETAVTRTAGSFGSPSSSLSGTFKPTRLLLALVGGETLTAGRFWLRTSESPTGLRSTLLRAVVLLSW